MTDSPEDEAKEGSYPRPNQDGTSGFNAQLAGQGIAGRSDTSTFDINKVPAHHENIGGIKRPDHDVTTSANGRIIPPRQSEEDNPPEPDPARQQQKERKQLPLHDEPIGGG